MAGYGILVPHEAVICSDGLICRSHRPMFRSIILECGQDIVHAFQPGASHLVHVMRAQALILINKNVLMLMFSVAGTNPKFWSHPIYNTMASFLF